MNKEKENVSVTIIISGFEGYTLDIPKTDENVTEEELNHLALIEFRKQCILNPDVIIRLLLDHAKVEVD